MSKNRKRQGYSKETGQGEEDPMRLPRCVAFLKTIPMPHHLPGFLDGESYAKLAKLRTLTFMDPCCGTGMMLRGAFDRYMTFYREQLPWMSAEEIANNIFKYNLHGIDMDSRVVELCKFTLWMRAIDFIRAESLLERKIGKVDYPMPEMKIEACLTKEEIEKAKQQLKDYVNANAR